jgi:anti-sigma B factor antagonist
MTQLIRVVDEEVGEVALVALDGEIDASNARDVAERLRGALTNRSLALVVDLAETRYIDSAGINELFALDVELRQRRQQLHLVMRPGSAVARVAGIVGLDRTVTTHAERAAALAAATPHPRLER